jgi:hypothetical protein
MTFGRSSDGGVTHIKDAANGSACKCHCIECGAPLVAKQGNVLEWHFAHAAETGCQGYNPETLLHYRAKHMFADMARKEGLHSLMPEDTFDIDTESDNTSYDWVSCVPDITIASQLFAPVARFLLPDKTCYVSVEGVSPCGTYRPDVAIHPVPQHLEDAIYGDEYDGYDGPSVFVRRAFVGVEIVVTHDIDESKLRKIKDANDVSIRVDISKVDRDLDDGHLALAIKNNIKVISLGQGHLDCTAFAKEWQRASKKNKERLEDSLAELLEKWLGPGLDYVDVEGVHANTLNLWVHFG